jgi:hypothetical protein
MEPVVFIPWWLWLLLATVGLPFLVVFFVVKLLVEIVLEGIDRAHQQR